MANLEERMAKMTEFLNSDEERGRQFLSLSPSEAVAEINACGHEFTVDELQTYGGLLKNALKLDDEALEGVAGGAGRDMDDFASADNVGLLANFMPPTFVIAYGVPATQGVVGVGIIAGNNIGWLRP